LSFYQRDVPALAPRGGDIVSTDPTAKTCAISAYWLLACSNFQDLFDHEGAQKQVSCLLECSWQQCRMYACRMCRSDNATLQQLQTGTQKCQHTTIKLPERQDYDFQGMLFIRAQMVHGHRYRRASGMGAIWLLAGAHMDEYVFHILFCLSEPRGMWHLERSMFWTVAGAANGVLW
jgi:hypothetical protein